ncbi:MAG: TrkH family potassium uptake protein [Paracoccaceae bacterium]|nr:TrkH family potassium uptake protein [Paracoccaceae bacterium]
MIDLRPVGYVIGLLVTVLGVAMVVPVGLDLFYRSGNAGAFLEASAITVLVGLSLTLSTANGVGERLTLQQTFLITTGVWLALPLFGALPFFIGQPGLRYVDAFFEAMSGLTTTGATVMSNLIYQPPGVLAWRAMLQWFGGIGIIVVAMVFLPELRIGGMQIFRSEGFDTFGKILPRAQAIATRISVIYIGLTAVCALAYGFFGMDAFDAITHAMTTIATGGFANYDLSFGAFGPGVEYTAVLFMMLAAMPFVRYVQMLGGAPGAVFIDRQVRGFFWVLAVSVCVMTLWLWTQTGFQPETAFRKALFNVTSIVTGTGYVSADYMVWGAFPVAAFFFLGLIGGCAGSTSCSIKIFRYQLLIASIRTQVKAIHSPHGVFTPRYDGRPVSEDVLSSVMAFFVLFIVTLGVIAVLLGATGLDFVTSVTGAAAALANIGPGLGPVIGPAGTYAPLSDTAKWILSAAMLIGRLELMAVYAIVTLRFWQA